MGLVDLRQGCGVIAPPGRGARNLSIDPDALVLALADHLSLWLPTQRWFSGRGEPPQVVVPLELEPLGERWPMLVWVPVRVTPADGPEVTYQLVLALARELPVDVPEVAVVGEVPVPGGSAVAFDALAHPDSCLRLAASVAPELTFRRAQPVRGDHSNSSVVLDDRWMMKVYRRLEDGPNPDVEMTVALGRMGCTTVPVPVAVWRRHGHDLAVVRRLYTRARDGLAVAADSLSELLERRVQPRECRKDFRGSAEALGMAIAHLHVSLASAFGAEPASAEGLIGALTTHLRRVAPPGVDIAGIEASYRRLSAAEDLGMSIRIHGDLHLGQVLDTRRGWVIVDFEGEPSRPIGERRQPSSPLRDIAGMIRSFHYSSELALAATLPDPEEPPDQELALLCASWEERTSQAFVSGYTSVDEVHRLLPTSRASRDALLTLFELDKAVYEVAYELSHRPHLAGIPLRAVARLLDPEHRERW